MSKKKQPTYQLTPKGFIRLETNDDGITDAIMDSLELAARRQNCNAILINDKGWEFVSITKAGK